MPPNRAGQRHHRKIALRVPNFATLFQAMRHGSFVAFLPRQIAEQHLDVVRVLSTDLRIPAMKVIASWHPRMTKDARHMWVRQKLETAAVGMEAPPDFAAATS